MASSENTAVNELIAQVSGGPVSSSTEVPAAPEPNPMHTTRPVTMPVAAPFEAREPRLPGFEPSAPVNAEPIPLAAPPAGAYRDPAAAQAWRPPPGAVWSEPTQLVRPRSREPLVGTHRMRHTDLRIVIGKLVLPMVLLVIAGLAIGGYVVFRGGGLTPAHGRVAASAADPGPATPGAIAPASPATAATPVEPVPEPAAAANAAVPVADPVVPEPAPAPPEAAAKPMALIDVRIDSTPSGATVMLVDRGKTQLIGTTPINAAVDASREYDLVFTYPDRTTQIEHLNAKATRRVAVTLRTAASATKAAQPTDSPPLHAENPSAAPAQAPVKKASAEPARKAARAPAEPLGEGILKISSKPPCEIAIDGKPTGLTTPQLGIPLPAGNHKITLVNREKGIKKTVSVQITANTTEKIVDDLMK